MRRVITGGLGVALGAVVWIAASHGATPPEALPPPAWAYPMNPGAVVPKDDGAKVSVPDAALAFTMTQLRNQFSPPDWHPQDHGPMPPVVREGRAPQVRACGFCHLPTGDGRPENAPLAGLPEQYIVRQMADFKSGARQTTVLHRGPIETMRASAVGATDAEVAEAAAYFAHQKRRSYMAVVEAKDIPRVGERNWIMALVPDGGREPLGNRIVEAPTDFERFERRDGRVPIIAYVPKGSIAKGRKLAAGRGPEACVACHGNDLAGVGEIPALAGKSPSYVVRQLYDFRSGARAGELAGPMKTVAEHLSATDIINVAAYIAAAKPPKG